MDNKILEILKPKSEQEILEYISTLSPVDAFIMKFFYYTHGIPVYYVDTDLLDKIITPNIKVSIDETVERPPAIMFGGNVVSLSHFRKKIKINVCDNPSIEGNYEDKTIIIEDGEKTIVDNTQWSQKARERLWP